MERWWKMYQTVSEFLILWKKNPTNSGLTLVFFISISVFPLIVTWVLKPKILHRWETQMGFVVCFLAIQGCEEQFEIENWLFWKQIFYTLLRVKNTSVFLFSSWAAEIFIPNRQSDQFNCEGERLQLACEVVSHTNQLTNQSMRFARIPPLPTFFAVLGLLGGLCPGLSAATAVAAVGLLDATCELMYFAM